MFIAVVGCGHGEIDKIYEVVAQIESQRGIKVSLVLCCGDFQSVRNMTDLRCMACPIKYQQMHDFHRYYSGEKVAPVPTIFIGGNHEASNYLQELPYGGWVAPNIYFLGSNVIRFGSVRIAGISGIFKGHDYVKGRYECPPYNQSSMRSVYHYRNLDTFRLKQVNSPVDIVISHDWPQNIHLHGDTLTLLRQKPYFREEIEREQFGSRPLAELLSHLQPSYWFSAHMHVKFCATVCHGSAGEALKLTKFLALDKILPRKQFLQVIEFPGDETLEQNLSYDSEWLAILRSTNHLISVKESSGYMPGSNSRGERFDFSPTAQEVTKVQEMALGNFRIPENFVQTGPVYEMGERAGVAYPMENQQTTEFCDKWQVSDPIRFLPAYVNGLGGVAGTNDEREAEWTTASDEQAVIIQLNPSVEAIAFTKTTFNPDEIEIDDDEDPDALNVRGQPSLSKMTLPPPRHDLDGTTTEKLEEDALNFLTSALSYTEGTSEQPLFVLDTLGEPGVKRCRKTPSEPIDQF